MENKDLRRELQRITKTDVSTHAAQISALSPAFQCSIEVLPDYDLSSRENFNCFEYALGLNFSLHNATRVTLSLQHDVLADCRFIEFLKRSGALHLKNVLDMKDDDIVIYFVESHAKHAGRWNRGRIVSKWGGGLMCRHGPYEIQICYGEPFYFEQITRNLAKEKFLDFARHKNVPEEDLIDP